MLVIWVTFVLALLVPTGVFSAVVLTRAGINAESLLGGGLEWTAGFTLLAALAVFLYQRLRRSGASSATDRARSR